MAAAFEFECDSFRCQEFRPGGFSENDPSHACEILSVKAVEFTDEFSSNRFRNGC